MGCHLKIRQTTMAGTLMMSQACGNDLAAVLGLVAVSYAHKPTHHHKGSAGRQISDLLLPQDGCERGSSSFDALKSKARNQMPTAVLHMAMKKGRELPADFWAARHVMCRSDPQVQ